MAGVGISVVALAFGGYTTYTSLNKPAVVAAIAPTAHLPPVAAAAAKPKATPAEAVAKFAQGAILGIVGGDLRERRDPLKFAFAAFRKLQVSAGEAAQRTAAGVAQSGAAPRFQLVFGGDANGGLEVTAKTDGAKAAGTATSGATPDASASQQKAAGARDAARDKPAIHWAAAEKHESQGTGSLKVTITKVLVGKVGSSRIGGGPDAFPSITGDDRMTIWFKIRNTDAAGSADYTGWMGVKAEKAKISSELDDDQGGTYQHFQFRPEEAIVGSIQGRGPLRPIFAGQSVADALVFPAMPAGVDSIELTLSGKGIGQDEDLHFRIPKSMIKSFTPNLLVPGVGG